MATKDQLLNELLGFLRHQASLPLPAGDAAAAMNKASGHIANRLEVALAAPEHEDGALTFIFRPGDMAVTVVWPEGPGRLQGLTFDRSEFLVADTLTELDRQILRTLLGHALMQLDGVTP